MFAKIVHVVGDGKSRTVIDNRNKQAIVALNNERGVDGELG